MNFPTLLVLAAGMGSRYGGLKQLDPMGPHGETILDYSVYDAMRAGFGRVVFVIREDFAESFRQSVGKRFDRHIEVAYAYQRLDDLPEGFTVPPGRTKPWGTTHAVRAARDVIHEPFAVINADDFYGREAYLRAVEFLRHHGAGSRYCLVGYRLANTLSDYGGVNRGIASSEGGLLRNIEEVVEIAPADDGTIVGQSVAGESRELDSRTLVSMNFWGFTPLFFQQLETRFRDFLRAHGDQPKAECYIPTVMDALIADREASCEILTTEGAWFGVTYPGDKPRAVKAIQGLVDAGEYPPSLDQGP